MCARMMERSLHPGCVIVNYYVQCGGVLCTMGSGIEIEVGVKRRVPLFPWGRVAGRHEMTLQAQSLAYIPGVCVFPAHSGFTPGWAYVLVVGCAACLICPRLVTCIVGFLMCLALHQ